MALSTSSFTGSPLHLGTNDLVAAFTNAYLNIMQELISYETPGQAVFGNKGNLVEWGKGVTATFPTRKPARRGIVGDVSNRLGRIPRGGNPTYSMASFEAMTHRLAINFDWNAMNTASNERYIANLVKNALSDVKTQWNRRQNIWLYGGELNNPQRIGLKDGANVEQVFANSTAGSNTISNGAVAVLSVAASADDKTIKVRLPITMIENQAGKCSDTDFVQNGAQWIEPGDFLSLVEVTTGLAEYVQVTAIDRTNYASTSGGDAAPVGYAELTIVGSHAGGGLANAYGKYEWAGTAAAQASDAGTIIHLASPAEVARPNGAGVPTASGSTSLQDSDIMGAYPGFGSITGPLHRNKITDNSGNGIPTYLGMTKDQYWSSEAVNFEAFGTGTATSTKTGNMDFLVLDRILHQINAMHHRRPDCLFMNPQVWMEWVSESNTNHEFRNSSSIPPRPGNATATGAGVPVNLTYQSIEAVTGVGTLDVIIDPFCPAYTMYAVNKGDVGYMERFPLTMAKDDGSEFRFPTDGVDTLEAFMRVVSTFVALHPAAVNKITGVHQDTPVL